MKGMDAGLLKFFTILKKDIKISLCCLFILFSGCHVVAVPGTPVIIGVDHYFYRYQINERVAHDISTSFIYKKAGNNRIPDESQTGQVINKRFRWLNYRNFWIYLLPFTVIFWGIRKYELSRIRLRNRFKIADIETQKLRETDQIKTRLFSGISREIRTPLTLIKGGLEQLIGETDDPKIKRTLNSIYGNTARLLQLDNQLFDLSLIQSKDYNIETGMGDVVKLVKGIAMFYKPVTDKKNILLSVEETPEVNNPDFRKKFYYDPGIFEKVLINLLSNVIEFTHEGGRIAIKICRNSDNRQGDFLEIIIMNTGTGIPEDKLSYIYDHNNKSEIQDNIDGFELTFTLVKELVRIHKGRIRLKSLQNAGTVISLTFPAGEKYSSNDGSNSGKQLPSSDYYDISYSHNPYYGNATFFPDHPAVDHIKPWVLVVEQYAEVREYISEILQKDYRVIHSSNTDEGLEKANDFIPDLIIIEVKRPETESYKLGENLKNSEKTSHIPVILLIATADEQDKIKALSTGVDGFMIKPFSSKELKARVDNLIKSRRILREKFTRGSIINPGEIMVSSRDTVLMNRLLEVVEMNIENHEFSVKDLGKEVGMSKSQIHRKLKALVNMSATQFIRSIRMHKAMELLKMDAGTIAEIAYMVGYDDPGYFTRSFRNFFGKLPSEVIRKK